MIGHHAKSVNFTERIERGNDMFFKLSILKKLLKNAYNGPGLVVGHCEELEKTEIQREGYYVAGSYWSMWFDAERMPKEAKAAIIELCGDLPEEGEVFKAHKEAGNQYEIEQQEIYNLPKRYSEAEIELNKTKIIIDGYGAKNRLLQEEESKNITAINEMFMDLIDVDAVDYDNGEHEPYGPIAASPNPQAVFWGNNICYLMACTRIINDEEAINYFKYLEKEKAI